MINFNTICHKYTILKKIVKFESYIKEQVPKFGSDFISVAKYFLTPEIKFDLALLYDEVTNLKPTSKYDWRMQATNDIVRRNLELILKE